MAAVHQSSITFAFIIAEAEKIESLLRSSNATDHSKAANDSDVLWDLIHNHAHKEIMDKIGMDIMFLTDVRNWIQRDYNIDNARTMIASFIRCTRRKSKNTIKSTSTTSTDE